MTDGLRPIVLTPEERRGLDYQQQVELVNEKVRAALVGKQLGKSEMFSFFQFGGSDCVMVFERKANVAVTAAVGAHYQVRSQYAISNINW
jgi:phosphatidylserine decarboxylase